MKRDICLRLQIRLVLSLYFLGNWFYITDVIVYNFKNLIIFNILMVALIFNTLSSIYEKRIEDLKVIKYRWWRK